MKRIAKRISVFLALVIVLCSLSGCFLFDSASISFNTSSLNLSVGQSLNIDPYIKTNGSDGIYTLSSSNESVLTVTARNTVKAIARGTVELKAELNERVNATVTVRVDYAAVSSVTLHSTSELFQLTGETSPITFTALLNEGADPSIDFVWTVNGAPVYGDSNTYTLDAQSEAGDYAVQVLSAANPAINDTKTLRVYDAYGEPELVCLGQTLLSAPSDETTFCVNVDNPETNPELYAEWLVGGQVVKTEFTNEPSFTFVAEKADKYKVSVRINGKTVQGEGGASYVEVTVRGVVNPEGLSIDFKNEYPKVYLNWQNREDTDFEIKITPKGGGTAQTLPLVRASDGRVDISSAINVKASYDIGVKSVDTGDVYLGSAGYTAVRFNALSSDAVTYLSAKFLGGNRYLTSDEELYGVFEYIVAFRPNATIKTDPSDGVAKECVSLKCYMGFTSQKSALQMSKSFEDRLMFTGKYSWSLEGSLTSGSIVTISVYFGHVNKPDNFSIAGKKEHVQLLRPKTGEGGYGDMLPIDGYPLSASEAATSDQLFVTAEKRLKPLLKQGSDAQSLYASAYDVLTKIITPSMDEAEKAAAIYDWVMFAVSYDYQVVGKAYSETSVAVKQPAFYLEGVFGTGYAVCDGISKAYSLLCNMAGIPCVRVIGKASGGSHAWNKVCIGGEWYIVDATWGIGTWELPLKGNKTYKLATKSWFLLTDAEAGMSRVESGMSYPATAKKSFNYYNKYGVFVHDTASLSDQLREIAKSVRDDRANKSYTVAGQAYTADLYAIEFGVSATLLGRFAGGGGDLGDMLKSLGFSSSSYRVIIVNNTIILAVA